MARALLTNVDGFGLGGLSSSAASLFLDQAYISAVQAGELIAVTDRGGTASLFAPTATAFSAELGNFAGDGELALPSDTGPTDALGSGVAPGFDITTPTSQAAFTAGNIVVYRIGTGAAALSSAATQVFLDEYNPTAGALVQTIPLPTSNNGANLALTASGTATSEGLITLSADGRYILAPGYNAAPGTASVASTTSTAVPRVVARIDGAGNVDTTTGFTDAYSANNIRSAASVDGSAIYTGGTGTTTFGGVHYGTLGSTTSTQIESTPLNIRNVAIFGGQLYLSASSTPFLGIATVGTGTPTTSGQTVTQITPTYGTGNPSPYQFFFADLTSSVAGVDTLYVADDRTTANGGGIAKFSLVGGSWVLNNIYAGTGTVGARGLTGVVSGSNVTLYATTTETSANRLISITDTSGYNGTLSGTATTVATATTNTVFRGVAPAPLAGENQVASISVSPTSQNEGNSGSTAYTFTVTRTGGTSGALSFIANFGAVDTNATDFSGSTLPGTVNGTILAGEATATFTVNVAGDASIESNENFTYTLGSVSNGTAASATIGTATATATITNDDSPPPAPVLTSSTPTDNATGVAIGANIVLTFDQNVQAGTGNIILRPATGSDIAIAVANAQVTFSGSTVTINPTADLRPGVAYDVIIASGVITNSGGTAFAGIALDALDFTSSFSIPDGTFNAPFVIQDPGTFTLLSGTTRNASGSSGVLVAAATGPVNVTIDGTLNFASIGQRAINYGNFLVNGTISVGASGVVQSLNGDAIRSQSARGQIDLTNLGQIIARSVAFTPSVGGTNPGTAFAITYNAALGATGAPSTDFTTGGTINNGSVGNTTALIRADNGDAIRVGSHQTLNNYGTINGNGPVNDAATNNVFNGANGNPNTSVTQTYDVSRGVRVNQGAATAVAVNNFGTITGAQHGLDVGVTDATNLIFTNSAGGQIIGRNGSGIGADTTGAAANTVTVINSGLIRGDYAPAFDRAGYVTIDGDGDGVDIDGGATITNNVGGIIRSTGAGGFDSGGRANNSEAISIGGGQITNQGTIEGFNFGIVVNNDSNANNSRSGSTATTILNYAGGTISGGTGFAIRLENKTGTAIDNDAITNYGSITGTGTVPTGTVLRQDNVADPGAVGTLDGVTYTAADAGNARFIRGDGAAIQMGEGNDTLANYGTITGNSGRAINLEGGADQLTLRTGSSITGRIDGGAGTDTLILALDDRVAGNAQTGANSGITTGSLTNVINFENLTVTSGTWTITDAQAYSGGVALNGGRLNLNVAVTGAITFGAGAQTLGIANAALGTDVAMTLGNAITGFGADGDVLDFTGIAAGTVIASYNATTGLLKLIDFGDTAQATINVGTGLGAFAFSLANNGSGGTAVSLVANTGGNTGFGGSGGNDDYTGTPGNDLFNFSQGGNDKVSGGAGNDGFFFGAALTATDRVDGGAGTNDQIGLQGNYSGANALTLGASTISNVEVIAVLTGFSYDITTVDDNIGAGRILTFFGTNLGATDNFTVNASAETDGAVRIYGGLGIDTFTGGAGDDGFYFGPGRFNPATDTVNGGAGTNDQVAFDGNFTGTLSSTQITNVEVLALLAGVAGDLATYNIQFANSLVGAGQNFTVFALPVQTALQLDASAELDGNYTFTAGSGADTLIGGAGGDTFFGGLGADVLTGGLGNDLFRYTAVNETLAATRDRITDFAAGDRIELTQIDADGNAGNGDTAFAFIGAGAFTNVAGQLRVIASGADWLIEGDVNGDGAADFQILAQGAQPLEAQFAL